MLVVETIAKIRRAYFIQGKSIKQICRELRVSRNTVRKVVRSGAAAPSRVLICGSLYLAGAVLRANDPARGARTAPGSANPYTH